MLPTNIIANWCRTTARPDHFWSVLREYAERADGNVYPEYICAASWIERTLFSVGDSEWSRTEGSLVFENRRAALWRPDPNDSDQSHLIFIALFPSSLVNLRQSVGDLMKERHEREVTPATFDLLGALESLKPGEVVGAEIAGPHEERIVFSGASLLSNPYQNISYMAEAAGRAGERQADFRVSKLFLRLGERKTGFALSRDGVLTFNDPDLTIDEIIDVTSEVIRAVPNGTEEGAAA